jgi:hypothetical protein
MSSYSVHLVELRRFYRGATSKSSERTHGECAFWFDCVTPSGSATFRKATCSRRTIVDTRMTTKVDQQAFPLVALASREDEVDRRTSTLDISPAGVPDDYVCVCGCVHFCPLLIVRLAAPSRGGRAISAIVAGESVTIRGVIRSRSKWRRRARRSEAGSEPREQGRVMRASSAKFWHSALREVGPTARVAQF